MSTKISVLITGASTGIGRSLALDLAGSGHQVFASFRKQKDADTILSSAPSVIPLIFDVVDESAISMAAERVRTTLNRSLPFCLVNNAGVAIAGPLEDLSMKEIKNQFEVNVFGALAVTKAFLNLVREQNKNGSGRIVNMSSISGLVASPFLGPYCASKFALEAFSDALRRELMEEDIKVLIIEPGPIQTPIWEKGLAADHSKISERYKQAIGHFETYAKNSASSALPTDHVVTAVRNALLSPSPNNREIVTRLRQRIEIELGRWLPSKWVDAAVRKQLFRR